MFGGFARFLASGKKKGRLDGPPAVRGVPFGNAIFTTVTKGWQTELRARATPEGAAADAQAAVAGHVTFVPMQLKVAAAQMCSGEDVAENLRVAADLVRAAGRDGAQLVGLPENFAYLGSSKDHKLAIAEPAGEDEGPGPILSAMRGVAREAGVWLLLGGFPEQVPGFPDRIGNTSLLLDPSGAIRARYRKMHLFDVEIPGGSRFCESDTIVAGDAPIVAETPWGGLGLSICYDLRFPELYRALASKGARIISVPAAFTRETGKDHWHVLLRARAIENQAYVFAPAQWGFHGGKRASYGHALVIDPWGVVLAECGERDGYALAPIDFAYQDKVRTTLPALAHRRL
jgi:deaminated glutathione amidase